MHQVIADPGCDCKTKLSFKKKKKNRDPTLAVALFRCTFPHFIAHYHVKSTDLAEVQHHTLFNTTAVK